MSSQILITGATGFIGRQLTRDLARKGHAVRVLARDRAKAEALFRDGIAKGQRIEVAAGDLLDAASIRAASRGVETVYHIGGIYRFGLRHRRELWETNVAGTERVLQAAADAGVGKVVHLSSGGLMKARVPRGNPLLNEDDYPDAPPPFSSYKHSKWHAEQKALAWAARGLPVVIASPTCPIGPEDELPTPTGRIIADFLGGRFPFYCRTGLNFVGVGDLSEGLQRVALLGRPGERYLLGHHNLWLKQFLDILAEETGLPSPRFALPFWTVCLAGLGGEAIHFVRAGGHATRVCLETALQSGRVQFFSNAKAREELGWKPARPVRLSIRDAVAWAQGAGAGASPSAEPSRREAASSVPSSAEQHVG